MRALLVVAMSFLLLIGASSVSRAEDTKKPAAKTVAGPDDFKVVLRSWSKLDLAKTRKALAAAANVKTVGEGGLAAAFADRKMDDGTVVKNHGCVLSSFILLSVDGRNILKRDIQKVADAEKLELAVFEDPPQLSRYIIVMRRWVSADAAAMKTLVAAIEGVTAVSDASVTSGVGKREGQAGEHAYVTLTFTTTVKDGVELRKAAVEKSLGKDDYEVLSVKYSPSRKKGVYSGC